MLSSKEPDVREVIDLLREKSLTIATAESCTGGLIGAELVNVPGASDVYGYGFITYANEAKEKILGVKRETLSTVGAVSPETAEEMARGAAYAAGSDLAVSVTGIAGPGGGSPEKPVGLVYIGLYDRGNVIVKKCLFSGDRKEIRNQTRDTALSLILRALRG